MKRDEKPAGRKPRAKSAKLTKGRIDMSDIEKAVDFEALVGRIQATSEALQQDALLVINRSVTARAWITGYYIVEYEQHGADRAKYGEGLLKKLAERLNDDKFHLSSLKSYRLFFRVYPELAEPVRAYLVSRFGGGCSLPKQISQTLSGLLTEGQVIDVREKSQTLSGFSDGDQILLISGKDVQINPYALFNRISFSHIVELLKMPVEMMRTFYAFEAIRVPHQPVDNGWCESPVQNRIGQCDAH